jgi:hypothetical protein
MKLELILKSDADSTRYQVKKNDFLEKSFHFSKEEEKEKALSEATEYYERLKTPVEETLILSEEI